MRDEFFEDEPFETIERLSFFVEGVPQPQGSKTVFRGRAVDANAVRLKPWREAVRLAAVDALAGRSGFAAQVEVALFVSFSLPRPKTVRRRRPSVKPDVDKLLRAVGDALTDSGVLADDAQVVSVSGKKFYADDKPGAFVAVRELA